MNKDIAIKVENLSKVYKLYNAPIDRMKEALNPFKKSYHKEFYALNDVSFEVKKGETVGIIGKNGSGKSTLLKIITGVLNPTAGKVMVNGRISALLELGAGFNLEYTGMENIYFQGNIMGFNREEMSGKVDSIIKFADIGDFIYQPVKNYSSGMFARLAFAVAISVEPDILIVDEALSVGDANFQLKCHKRMDELRSNGVTILFVSHDTYSVKTLCRTALFLNNGNQLAYGKSLNVVNDYLLFLDNETKTDPVNYLEEVEVMQESIKDSDVPVRLPVKITTVEVLGKLKVNENEVNVTTGDDIEVFVEFDVVSNELDEAVFVFNLYREKDKVYVCGTTSIMDNVPPVKVKIGTNSFKFRLKGFSLLSGKYRLRVAINEKKGLGILCEENNAIVFIVKDNHEAEGLFNIGRSWIV